MPKEIALVRPELCFVSVIRVGADLDSDTGLLELIDLECIRLQGTRLSKNLYSQIQNKYKINAVLYYQSGSVLPASARQYILIYCVRHFW